MDADRFDALAKALATRRRLLGALAGAAGGLIARGGTRSAAIHLYCGVACADTINNCSFPDDGCGTCCGDVCVDPTKDPNNCGPCGNVCPNGGACVNAVCQVTCAAGQTLCGDACVDLAHDPHNCLACGVACGATEACCANGCLDISGDAANCGDCGVACDNGFSCCTGACWDLAHDANHCGGCDVVCANGQNCADGQCLGQCPNGQTACPNGCADLGSDAANCGSCGNACAAGATCQNGTCVAPPACPAPRILCGDACVDAANDANNCGGCGVVCGPAQFCGRSACRDRCPGQLLCGEVCVNAQIDGQNCGACGNACPSGQACQRGSCVTACRGAQTVCNGGCVDLQTDLKNCGACGVVCPTGWTCQKGVCFLHRSVSGSVVTRRRFSPAFCQVSARPYESVAALMTGHVVPSSITPTPFPITPTPTPTPEGTPIIQSGVTPVPGNPITWPAIRSGVKLTPKPASDVLRAAIENTVGQISACANAGDPARQTALMTDAMAARFLTDRGLTGAALKTAFTTPAVALPDASWEEISEITHVLDLGHGVASAVISHPAPVDGLSPWSEEQVYKQIAGEWRLDTKAVMKRPNDPGAIVLRGWDCLLNMTRETFESDLCTPSVFDEPWALTLSSTDGKTTRWLAVPDASFPEDGVAIWEKLPPGDYILDLVGMRKIGPPVVAFGAEPVNDDPLSFRIVLGGRNPYVTIDVYKLPTTASQVSTELARRLVRAYRCPTCPPCHVCDLGRGICAYTCPQCSTCKTYLNPTLGETFSTCENGCTANQGICRHDRCCQGRGHACAADADCCNGICYKGACSCVGLDSACSEDADCCQTDAFSTVRCADTVVCHVVQPLGHACSNDLDCYPGQCFKGTCHCCATPCETGSVNSAGLCCEYPRVPLCQPDSSLGKGFVRCCAPGIDCAGDPNGPPANAPGYVQGTPVICT